jgi:hypothetical protein
VLAGADLDHLDPDDRRPLVLSSSAPASSPTPRRSCAPCSSTPRRPDLLALAAILAEHQGRLASPPTSRPRPRGHRSELPLASSAPPTAGSSTSAPASPSRSSPGTRMPRRARTPSTSPSTSPPAGAPRTPTTPRSTSAARPSCSPSASPPRPCATSTASSSATRRGRRPRPRRNLLEREGRFAEADRSWQQAIAVEPTNPTWLLGRAHNLPRHRRRRHRPRPRRAGRRRQVAGPLLSATSC